MSKFLRVEPSDSLPSDRLPSLPNEVMEGSSLGIFILDADFQIVWLNPAIETFFGIQRSAVLGQDKRQLIQTHIASIFEDPESFAHTVLATYDNNTYVEQFECHVLPDIHRQERWLEHRSEPIQTGLYAGGRVEYYIDITARKQADQQLRQQAMLLDVATDAIFVRDLDNRILFWNQGATRLYGWTAAEAQGKLSHELFQSECWQGFDVGLHCTLEQGYWQGELTHRTKAGHSILVDSHWTLVRDTAGQPQSLLVVNTDITNKKRLEHKACQVQRLESLGTLSSGIAHDLNNILTPILSMVQLLRYAHPDLDPMILQRLQWIEDSAKQGSNFVKQILTFVRGGEGKRSSIDLGALIPEMLAQIQPIFPPSITLRTQIPPDSCDRIWAEPTHLTQVIMNLCVNARDAMPQGGILTVSVHSCWVDAVLAQQTVGAQDGHYVCLTVADTGTGIPPHLRDRIFDPFFTTKAAGQGTGLGLSTVAGIVKSDGGFVQVCSEVGQGPSVTI